MKEISQISSIDYNELVAEKSQQLFGKAVDKLTKPEAETFVKTIAELKPDTGIGIYNAAMQQVSKLNGRTSQVFVELSGTGEQTSLRVVAELGERLATQTASAAVANTAESAALTAVEEGVAPKLLKGVLVTGEAISIYGIAINVLTMDSPARAEVLPYVPVPRPSSQFPEPPPGWYRELIPIHQLSFNDEIYKGDTYYSSGNVDRVEAPLGGNLGYLPRAEFNVDKLLGTDVSRGWFGYYATMHSRIAYSREASNWNALYDDQRAAEWQKYRDRQ